MLKLKKVDTFKVRVVATQPTEDPDRTREVTFVGEFRHLNRADFDELMASKPSDTEFLERVLVNTAEIADESGQPVPFDVARDAIAQDLALAAATVRTYMEALGGASTKNSPRSPAR